MLIAVLGGLGFLGYLIFTISAANENERRISDLHSIKFPIIEEMLRLKRDVGNVRESLSSALALEDYFLLEDSYESARNFTFRIGLINELEPETEAFTGSIQNSFEDYYSTAKNIVGILISDPGKSQQYESQLEDINNKLRQLNTQLDSAIQVRKHEYQVLLEKTDSEIKHANKVGMVLGTSLLFGLVALAWAVSVSVVRAVNRSNELKEVFLSTMSHELRTPINGISGAIGLLKQTNLSDEQVRLLDACRTSEVAITTTIDDILGFSSMMSGELQLTERPFVLYDAILHTLDLFTIDCRSKDLQFNIHTDVDEKKWVCGDEQKLTHALRHLVGNAVKFSAKGEIEVQLTLEDAEDERERIEICIQDTGPGIPKNYIAMAFEPFSQIDGSFSRQHQGVGIGLPICRNIAKAMGGDIYLENRTNGQGLIAKFTFFVGKIAACKADETLHPVENKKHGNADVLIVEDNKVNQLVLKGHLKKMGYQAQIAENGLEAVDKVEKHHFSLVLMDCQMPIMDGFEATREIRSLLAGKYHLPIVAVTANAMDGDKARCIEAGMDDYIKKPVDIDVLKEKVDHYINMASSQTIL